MAADLTHTCGWTYGPADKYCRGCGERTFKAVREYGEITAEIEAIKKLAIEKPYPAYTAVSMMLVNILSWAAGETNVRPVDLLAQMEKMAEKLPGGWGYPPSGPTQ